MELRFGRGRILSGRSAVYVGLWVFDTGHISWKI
jgi:hypothetical protein